MPIYEYRCQACGSVSEYLVGTGNDEVIRCKACGGRKVDKILSAAAVAAGSSRRMPGHTCCGREERCESPPCSGGGGCRRQ